MKFKWAKKCSECGKVLGSHNKSLLCFFHRIQKYNREYRKRTYVKVKKKKYDKEYSEKNKERLSHYYKEYYQKNKEKREEYYREYYQKNKDKILKQRKQQKSKSVTILK